MGLDHQLNMVQPYRGATFPTLPRNIQNMAAV
jgi:hypothetical protein